LTSCAAPVVVQGPATSTEPADYTDKKIADTDCSYFYFLWGRTAEIEKRYDEAVEAYEKAIVCDQYADFIIRKLAVLLVRLDRRQEAVNWIEKIVEDRSDDSQAQMLLASLYASVGDLKKAVDLYNSILKIDPVNYEAMLMLGTLYISTLDYDKAREVLERLVAKDPTSLAGFQYLAKLYRELKYYDKSLMAYEKALKINWMSSLALEAASLYEERNREDEAVAIYKKILNADYTNENAVGRLVRIYLKRGQLVKAIDVLHELRKYAMDTQRVDFSIGRIFLEQEKYDDAIAIFSEMLEVYPDFELARSVLALAYYEKGDRAKAKELLLMIPRNALGYEEALLLLLKIMREENDYVAAIALVTDIIAQGDLTYEMELYPILAGLYKEKGDTEAARRVFEQALEQYPDEPNLHFEYGMFLDRSGMPEEAMRQVHMVLEIDPEDPFALNYIGYTWVEQGKNLEEALKYIQKALNLRPEDGFIRDSLGWAYYKLGNTSKAIEELEKAMLIEGADPTIKEHLGDAYLQAGQERKAIKYYNESLALYEDEADKTRLKGKIEALN
jgi:tetratricopeptide (TPR) repeat protein